MIIAIKKGTQQERVKELVEWIENQDLRPSVSEGDFNTIVGIIGDTAKLDDQLIASLDIVQTVKRVSAPYKAVNREFHPHNSIIETCSAKIGDGNFAVIAGPCAVESREQLLSTAHAVKKAGATLLRGGAFKPRTSPYDFQGLKEEGIKLLLEARAETGLGVVTEIMNINHLPLFEDVDVIQVGARNMQNFELLKELGLTKKPILLKRGLSATIKELLMSAEYIMANGNDNIILCERGIRTFETATRNTMDISAVSVLRDLTHLPVVVDPSHATGVAKYVKPMALAATAAGADGLAIEVHPNPLKAFSDGPQTLTFDQFEDTMKGVSIIKDAISGLYN